MLICLINTSYPPATQLGAVIFNTIISSGSGYPLQVRSAGCSTINRQLPTVNCFLRLRFTGFPLLSGSLSAIEHLLSIPVYRLSNPLEMPIATSKIVKATLHKRNLASVKIKNFPAKKNFIPENFGFSLGNRDIPGNMLPAIV